MLHPLDTRFCTVPLPVSGDVWNLEFVMWERVTGWVTVDFSNRSLSSKWLPQPVYALKSSFEFHSSSYDEFVDFLMYRSHSDDPWGYLVNDRVMRHGSPEWVRLVSENVSMLDVFSEPL